jgi:hypothetical protein
VVAVDAKEVEGSSGFAPPIERLEFGGHGVVDSPEAGDRAGEGRSLVIAIGFNDGYVGAEAGDEESAEFLIGENFLWNAAVALVDGAKEIGVGQSVKRSLIPGGGGAGRGGDKEAGGLGETAAAKFARSFKCDFGTEAMPEEGVGAVEKGSDCIGGRGGEGGHRAKRLFAEADLATRGLEKCDFEGGVRFLRPVAEGADAAAGAGEADEAEGGVGPGTGTDNPRLHCRWGRKHKDAGQLLSIKVVNFFP